MTSKSLVAFALLIVMTVGSGCNTLTKEKGSKKSPWDAFKWRKKEYQTPTKMAVLWSPDLLTVAGQPPTRGFGGRIYFYNEKSQTIPVDGELVVHGFDETTKKATGQDTVPDKRFRFTAEQFTEHFSQSDLGASYSVWIPWDSNEHTLKELTLIPTFVSSSGQAVQGAPAKVILPGRNAAQPDNTTPVQTVAFEQETIPTVEGKLPVLNSPVRNASGQNVGKPGSDVKATDGTGSSDMRVTTIKLPAAIGHNPRGREQSPSNNGPSNNGATNMMTPGANNLSPVQPYVNAQLEQMRAQAVADAFRPMQQFASGAATTPGLVPGMQNGMQHTQSPSVHPGISDPQFSNAGQQQQYPQGIGMTSSQAVPQAPTPPRAFQTMPNSLNSTTPYRGDNYPGGLPPGFQLSPLGTAW